MRILEDSRPAKTYATTTGLDQYKKGTSTEMSSLRGIQLITLLNCKMITCYIFFMSMFMVLSGFWRTYPFSC